MMSHPSSFGAWVRQRRKALGLTQADLAEHVGCSSEMIRKVEMDKRRPSTQIAELLARRLEIPAAELPAFLRAARLARRDEPESAGVAEPPPEASSAVPRMSHLIGRAPLVEHVVGLLSSLRGGMITLTGPAGVGKTALAAEVAEHARTAFADGVLAVPMVTVEHVGQVLPALIEGLRLPQASKLPPLEQVIGHLRGRNMLLALDNMEHVAGVAPELGALLAACPALVVLATSRVPLRARGEHVIEVPPLDLPTHGAGDDPATLRQSSAVRLFEVRAREARSDFAMTPATAGVIAEICRRMDGLPLAIELVAARSNVLDPRALLERLNGMHGYAPLELPKNPLLAAPARHQTLRDAIGWSFNLLSGPQQHLFMWLGVFNGGFTLAAAEAVCTSDELRPVDVLDGLQTLIDAHLVARQPAEGDELRFTLLVTIREYALERLAAAGERHAAHAAHASYYLSLAEEMRSRFQKAGQEAAMDRLERELDNIRAGLRWTLEHAPEQAAQFGATLWWFWYVRSHWREGFTWLGQILQRIEQTALAVPETIHARVLRGASALADELAHYDQAATWATQSLALSRAAENWPGVIATLNNLGGLYHLQGHSDRARACFEEALHLSRTTDRPVGAGSALGCLASLATDIGDFGAAHRYVGESIAIMQALEYQFGVLSGVRYMADLALAEHDYEQAHAHYSHVLIEQRKHNNLPDVAMSLLGLGWISYYRGDPREAFRSQQEALRISHEQGAQQAVMLCLEGCAASLGGMGALESAQVYAAISAERERMGTPRQPTQQQALARAMSRAERLHKPGAWVGALEHGRAMPLAQCVALVLAL